MTKIDKDSGFANINNARIYYEVAGAGQPFIMIHAGIADSRQWNNEFQYFAAHFRVIRYDMRGFGRSEPVAGEFSHLQDLMALLEYLQIVDPAILMGCSMGGILAMDFAFHQPSAVKALVMVGSVPGGFSLDVPNPASFAEAEKAYEDEDFDLVAALEVQIWFDGMGRHPAQVNQPMRRLAYEMDRNRLAHYEKHLGTRLPNTHIQVAEHLDELRMPVLVMVGGHDVPFILAAADYMLDNIPSVQRVMLDDAAHLPNMDQPEAFQRAVTNFLG